jgi:hypothetical protein
VGVEQSGVQGVAGLGLVRSSKKCTFKAEVMGRETETVDTASHIEVRAQTSRE